jgi:hypothetical protein
VIHRHDFRVVEMSADVRVKLLQFAIVRCTKREDLRAHRADQVGDDHSSRSPDRINGGPDVDAHVLQTSLPVQLAEPTADQRVRAGARNATMNSSCSRSNTE